MMFIGAHHYYFWLGIKAAIYRLCGEDDMGPNMPNKTQESCLEAYMDGFMIGLELTTKEYKEMISGQH